jgi:HlyD family secretion protein
MNELVTSEKVKADIEAVLGLGGRQSALKRWRVPAVTAVISAGVLAYLLFGMGGSKSGVSYVTAPVTKSDLTVTVTATGAVQPTNEVQVSSELSGIVRTVLVDYNSKVKTGETLAVLDTDKLKSAVDSSKAKLAAAKAKVAETEATVLETKLERERKQMLVTRKVGSEQQLDTAEAAFQRALAGLETAKAEVEAAAADLALNDTNLQKADIVSPITGVVLSRNVEPGQTVASSLQAPILFTIAEDLTKMEVQVDIDEADVGNVKEGHGDLLRRCLSRQEIYRRDPRASLRLRGGAGRSHIQSRVDHRQFRFTSSSRHDGDRRDRGSAPQRCAHGAERGIALRARFRQSAYRQPKLPAEIDTGPAPLEKAGRAAGCR